MTNNIMEISDSSIKTILDIKPYTILLRLNNVHTNPP